MHQAILDIFDEICAGLDVRGRVLEIGASPQHATLLAMPALANATERIGIGLDGEAEGEGYSIQFGNANDLSRFADGSFSLVLSNSMLEHDPRFWLSVAEARRLTAPGGHFVVGVPAFGEMGEVPGAGTLRRLAALPFVGGRWRKAREIAGAATATLGIHDFPGDYYRFSEQAMRDVILEGMEEIATRLAFAPPRVIGIGRKPSPPSRRQP